MRLQCVAAVSSQDATEQDGVSLLATTTYSSFTLSNHMSRYLLVCVAVDYLATRTALQVLRSQGYKWDRERERESPENNSFTCLAEVDGEGKAVIGPLHIELNFRHRASCI